MAETIRVREGEDFDLGKVEAYLRERIEGLPEGSLEVRQFPSGASNLTYLVKIGEWEGVLRRPPLGPIPPKAHDMGRESALLSKLNAAYPLAPRPYFFTEDEEVIGAPFYVMERRKGVVVDDSFPEGVEPSRELCRGMSGMVAETLAELHAVDPEGAGLGDLGRPEGFLERQVKGWIGRYEKAQTDDVPAAGPLTDYLQKGIPESPEPTIIHNDFKLNNLILDPEDLTEVRAVLDWEMTTVGDPLFDLGVSMSYWVEPGDSDALKAVLPTVTAMPGFMSREEFMGHYGEASGRDVSGMDWYLVLGYFKLAGILQQIYARWKAGQTKDERFATFGERVTTLVEHANELAGTSSSRAAARVEPVRAVGVLGVGTMGAGIVQLAAQTGHSVVACDRSVEALERAERYVREGLRRFSDRGSFTQAEAEEFYGRITWTVDLSEMAPVGAAIEAIVEKVGPKKEAFRALDAILAPDALLLTNTSSISITDLASATSRPERVCGTHFFTPPPVREAVEVPRGLLTSDETLGRAKALVRAFGKIPIAIHKDVPGFVANRFLMPMLIEASRLLDEGVASKEDIDLLVKKGLGFPIGPFELGDFIGLDVGLDVIRYVHEELGDAYYTPPRLLKEMVRAGKLGRKTGEGFYSYGEEA